MFLPNAMTFDARGNLYVTESLRFTDTGVSGGVWRFAPDGTSELWIEDPLLSPESLQHPLDIPPVGANAWPWFAAWTFTMPTSWKAPGGAMWA